MAIRIKRAYEAAAEEDGKRILVDRLWPRGRSREALALEGWHKELAPSDGLRKWFGHRPERWEAFVERYRAELEAPAARERVEGLRRLSRKETVTLVYGAKDEAHNNAVVLRALIAGGRARPVTGSPPSRRAGAASSRGRRARG